MLCACIQDNIFVSKQELTEEQIQSLGSQYSLIIDISAASPVPSVGWILKGNKLVSPPGLDQTLYIQQNILEPAIEFGNQMMLKFTSENIGMGVTQAGKTSLIGETMKDLAFWLSVGSLYQAMTAIDAVVVTAEMSPFITSARLLVYKNKLRIYLGLAPL